jgi:hypothetical protein
MRIPIDAPLLKVKCFVFTNMILNASIVQDAARGWFVGLGNAVGLSATQWMPGRSNWPIRSRPRYVTATMSRSGPDFHLDANRQKMSVIAQVIDPIDLAYLGASRRPE